MAPRKRKPRREQFGGEPLIDASPEPAPLTPDEEEELRAHLVPETEEAVAVEEERQAREKKEQRTVPKKKDDDRGKVVPFEERKFTLEQYTRRKGDLGAAFSASESLSNGNKVIKRTRAEWDTRYEKWLEAPRG